MIRALAVPPHGGGIAPGGVPLAGRPALTAPLAVAAFYRFVALPDAPVLGTALATLGTALGVRGTILLAPEGINGTVAGASGSVAALVAALREGPLFGGRLAGMDVKSSAAAAMPFRRLKVRLKREIITLGATAADPTVRVGTPVGSETWNVLLDDPAVTVVDTRNGFEVAMGTFTGAVDPGLRRFGDFRTFAATLDPARHSRVAMFCTGGIRCEKASALLLSRGIETVYTLEGGILRYLETVPATRSRWQGACFVFDGRIALGHGLTEMPPLEVHGDR